jgi:uncharacterized protein YjdB
MVFRKLISGLPNYLRWFLSFALSAGAMSAETVFSEAFDGSSSEDVAGATPDTTTDAITWTGSSLLKQDGTWASGTRGGVWLALSGNAALAANHVYAATLEVDVSAATSGWVSIGFGSAGSIGVGDEAMPWAGASGVSWALLQPGNGNVQVFGGTATGNRWLNLNGFSDYTPAAATMEVRLTTGASLQDSSVEVFVGGIQMDLNGADDGFARMGVDASGFTYIGVARDQGAAVTMSSFTFESVAYAPVTGVELTPETLSLQVSQQSQLSAAVQPSNANFPDVTWASDNTSVVTVDESGNLTAVSGGQAIITVTTVQGGFTDTTVVTVTGTPVSGVELSHEVLPVSIGQYGRNLSYTVSPADAANKQVTWSSADPTIAEVTSEGLVKPVSVGETIVTVTTSDGSFTDTVTVTVDSGWTELTPHPKAKIYYVSSSEGDNTNDGLSPENPLATIFEGLSRIGPGDWLLMKRGDTFHETINFWQNGYSEEYKSVIGAYGDLSLPRPIIDPQGSMVSIWDGRGAGAGVPSPQPKSLEHVAIVSLHLYQSHNDPSSPNYRTNSAATAFRRYGPGRDVLFEDVRVDNFSNFVFEGVDDLYDVVIRRCQFLDAHTSNSTGSSGRSQGLYVYRVFGLLIEENFFDHNGWLEAAGDSPDLFSHNIYLSYDSLDTVVRRNLIARAAANGLQQRAGGVQEKNVFLQNAIAAFNSNNSVQPENPNEVMIVNDNVVLEGAPWSLSSDDPNLTRSWGLALNHSDDGGIPDVLEMKGNIVSHGIPNSDNDYVVAPEHQATADVSDNITYDWGTASWSPPDTPGDFPDPDRTSGEFNASLGGEATLEAFLATAREQRKGEWDTNYNWQGVWNYIREGFGVETVNWRPITGLSLAEAGPVTLYPGEFEDLDVTITPLHATDRELLWTSSDPAVAMVNQFGRVTGVSTGTATIEALALDGGLASLSLDVTVESAPENFAAVIGATTVTGQDSQYTSPWFGTFTEESALGGWVLHEGLGWLFAGHTQRPEVMWFWSYDLGTWTYTNENAFPWVWVRKDLNSPFRWIALNGNGWLYYYPQGDTVWYYNWATQSWL